MYIRNTNTQTDLCQHKPLPLLVVQARELRQRRQPVPCSSLCMCVRVCVRASLSLCVLPHPCVHALEERRGNGGRGQQEKDLDEAAKGKNGLVEKAEEKEAGGGECSHISRSCVDMQCDGANAAEFSPQFQIIPSIPPHPCGLALPSPSSPSSLLKRSRKLATRASRSPMVNVMKWIGRAERSREALLSSYHCPRRRGVNILKRLHTN